MCSLVSEHIYHEIKIVVSNPTGFRALFPAWSSCQQCELEQVSREVVTLQITQNIQMWQCSSENQGNKMLLAVVPLLCVVSYHIASCID